MKYHKTKVRKAVLEVRRELKSNDEAGVRFVVGEIARKYKLKPQCVRMAYYRFSEVPHDARCLLSEAQEAGLVATCQAMSLAAVPMRPMHVRALVKAAWNIEVRTIHCTLMYMDL
jgi:hypothetical protein